MTVRPSPFNRSVKVIQVFKKVHWYGKDQRSFETRKGVIDWSNVESKNGFVENGQLWLPPYLLEQPNFGHAGIMFLLDEENIGRIKREGEKSFILPYAKKYKVDCFVIEEALKIQFQYLPFEIGIPKRDHFTIGQLTPDQSLEFKINGKFDATLSRGMERLFKEQHFIIEYLGEFNEYYPIKEPVTAFKKNVPHNRKLVDLMKPLW